MPEKVEKEIHTYTIVKENGEEVGTYKGKQPRQAALKVANDLGGNKEKPVTFKLRQKGTKKLHVFEGYTQMVKTPENRPKWMKSEVRKPFVKKLRVEHPSA